MYAKKFAQISENTKILSAALNLAETDEDCAKTNPLGLERLCDATKQLTGDEKYQEIIGMTNTISTNVLGFCDNYKVNDIATGDPTTIADHFCMTRDNNPETLPTSAFDALSNDKNILTFGGASSLTMAYTVDQSRIIAQAAEFETTSAESNVRNLFLSRQQNFNLFLGFFYILFFF